jgi:hypothetical protein
MRVCRYIGHREIESAARSIDQAKRKRRLCLCRDLVWPCTEAAMRDLIGLPDEALAVSGIEAR